MEPVAIIRQLAVDGCLYATKTVSAAVVLRLADFIEPDEWQWLVAWSLAGQATGHEWCACTSCGELRLMVRPTKSAPRSCVTRPVMERMATKRDCPGFMRAIAPRPLMTKAVKRNLGMEA